LIPGGVKMRTIRILHCGDLHFDTPFRELSGKKAEARKEDLRETWGKIIDLIKKEEIQLVLMSGDLFDNGRIMKTTLEYLIKKLQEISPTPVFISPGNHDPYASNSYYQIIDWPDNVHIFGSTLEKVLLPQLGTCIYGIGFSKPYQRESLIRNFCVEDEKYINLMVLHGDVVSKGQDSNYNPITLEDIQKSKLDYLALGHQHSYSEINRTANTFWGYSGNPEGRGFDEQGSKGVLIGDIGKGYCRLNFYETCKRKYWEKKVDIGDAITYEEIIEQIYKQVKYGDPEQDLYKIILTGELSEKFKVDPFIVQQKLASAFYFIKIVEDTKIKIDYDTLEKTFSLKGIFVRKIREKMKHAQDETQKRRLELALKLGLYALEGQELNIE
jgi:exonuclease SbcD